MDAIIKIFTTLGMTEYAVMALFISIFVEVNPKIKFNPIHAILSYIGKSFNSGIEEEIKQFKSEVNKKFEDLRKEQAAQRDTLDKIIIDQDNKELSRIRWEVIDFYHSVVYNKEKHSRDQYRHILDQSNKFERIYASIHTDNFNNEDIIKMREAAESIKSHYEKHRVDQSAIML